LSPGFSVEKTELTFAIVFHGEEEESPFAESFPELLT
jgi:hypothetical protein